MEVGIHAGAPTCTPEEPPLAPLTTQHAAFQ